ncbi:PNPOx family protein [Nakamurella lactea]|uniref:nitroreductase/quinone reductase family protein n=1 Tax=Nakamurella lactea TaxID=459515 RepID=UPI001B7F8E36|nr:nitroreductase/quinone reductase family protein [Nakamurella lactea]
MTNDAAPQPAPNPVPHPAAGNAAERPQPRANKLRFQRFTNALIRGLLRTPLLCRLVGARLLTIYLVGRKSGRHYAIPVAYTAQGTDLLVGSPFGWIRNLRTGDPVDIRLKGRRVAADVRVFRDEQGAIAAYRTMARDNHAFAGFNKIGIGADGEPDAGDLRLAFEAGARAAVLTPR